MIKFISHEKTRSAILTLVNLRSLKQQQQQKDLVQEKKLGKDQEQIQSGPISLPEKRERSILSLH